MIILIATGCNSSKITTSWRAENVVVNHFNKIMVLALIREADRTIQEKMEDHFVDDLKALGYNAESSLKEYGPKMFDKMEEQAAIDKLKNSGVDAVITIVLLDKKKERKYVPGNMFYSPYGYYYGRFWGYRSSLYRRIYEPGYYITDTKYFWESNLYDMKTQQLVYSVQTQSFDPENAGSLGHEYGKLIVNNMLKQKVLQQRKAAAN
jgi:hypothetical protein